MPTASASNFTKCEAGEGGKEAAMGTKTDVRSVLRSADCVCFDVDSTVVTDEGIDELADFVGVGKEVAELTSRAMGGSGTFREALNSRLDIICPTQQQLADFVRETPPRLTDGIKELIELLHSQGVDVYLVSGGFRTIIEPIAQAVNVPKSNIFANRLRFYFNGDYAGFDERELTSDSGGKPKVIQHLKDKYGYQKVVHIGDGATDLEACPPADGFIGFGGNQIREKVQRESAWFVTSFQDLIDELHMKSTRRQNGFTKTPAEILENRDSTSSQTPELF